MKKKYLIFMNYYISTMENHLIERPLIENNKCKNFCNQISCKQLLFFLIGIFSIITVSYIGICINNPDNVICNICNKSDSCKLISY